MDRRLALAHAEILKLKKRVYRSEAYWMLHNAGRQARFALEFRSQFGEDTYLWDLFSGKLDGTFVEVGAYDGYTYSVTYAFEALGWNGYLIEGTPASAAAAVTRRPHSRVTHAALSKQGASGSTTFLVADDAAMLSSMVPTDELKARPPGSVKEVAVPLMTMDEVLREHSGPIDFAVIDTEGTEMDVLDGFDLARFRPRVLMIEDAYEHNASPFVPYLKQRGYTCVAYLWVNRVYVRTDEVPLIQKAVEMLEA